MSRRNVALLTICVIGCGAVTIEAQAVSAASTIRLDATEVTSGTNHASGTGYAVGDGLAYSEKLTDAATGGVAGYDAVNCTVVRIVNAAKRAGVLQCNLTARLKDGTLTAQGIVWQNGSDSRLAVTGGTGTYDGAAGNLLVSSPNVDTTQLTFTLQ